MDHATELSRGPVLNFSNRPALIELFSLAIIKARQTAVDQIIAGVNRQLDFVFQRLQTRLQR